MQSISAIVEAGLRALWRSPAAKFPAHGEVHPWEIWLERAEADRFLERAVALGIRFEGDRLQFPEDVVVVGHGTHDQIADAVRSFGTVKALAAPSVLSDYFEGIPPEEQAAWAQAMEGLVQPPHSVNPRFITLLDSGIGLNHPLIQPFLDPVDRHAAEPGWGLNDVHGHGTQLAGLSLYGDLLPVIQSNVPVHIGHRLESAKIIPDAGQNPHHLLGAVVLNAVNAVEANAERGRTFSMASTTDEDTPHDGAPTSWSSEIDQLTAGVSGNQHRQRLFVISAGNTDQNRFQGADYLSICDDPDHEIESPAQAWNSICVGAYTEKVRIPADLPGQAVALPGDLAPSSRTASWSSHWPIKPDVVMEGGNWVQDRLPPPMKHSALSLLTTDHQYPLRSLTTTADTSAATALAAKAITELWEDYPHLWPETIRAIFVSSARWTRQMKSHLPANPSKGDFTRLFQRYGYGVPDEARARRSAANALSLIVQDTINPYRPSTTAGAEPIHNQMKFFQLPWPKEVLRQLGATEVTLRVTLSTFIEPNPSEAARGSKFRYASHNLRFKLNRANENQAQFQARINKLADDPDAEPVADNDGWIFGRNRRDVGSLHIDEFRGPASDLARRNLLAVHPVAGWWKSKSIKDVGQKTARFVLVVELDAGAVEADLYTEIEAAIANLNIAQIAV
ncbi:S8 family peptidase [Tabrizicola sp. KVB23]|uniref:S8 family peptidase n=1 Tax=Fuscibacter oryzae TaxID=2803939 RepID=A0A8J7SWZ9_9RHOB|nr:S8 family peptidase [Fuscibacter oryzae]